MIKRITKKVVKEVTEVESEVGICDVCGKEFHYTESYVMGSIAGYYKIITGHNDWGSDSCESVEHTDACCDECLSRYTQEWLKNDEVVHSNTAYIEIHKATHLKRVNNG